MPIEAGIADIHILGKNNYIYIYIYLSILILSYPILSYPILSYPTLPYPTLSYPILSYPLLPYPILSIYIHLYTLISQLSLFWFFSSYHKKVCAFEPKEQPQGPVLCQVRHTRSELEEHEADWLLGI